MSSEELKNEKEKLMKVICSKHIYSKARNVEKTKEKVKYIPPRIRPSK